MNNNKVPDWIDPEIDKINGEYYFKDLEENFPELCDEFNLYEVNQYHLKMEVFANYTNQQIKGGSNKELLRCFHFQEERLSSINSNLENIIYVSYCETLLTENTRNKMLEIKNLMPEKLKWYYEDFEKYYIALWGKKNEK